MPDSHTNLVDEVRQWPRELASWCCVQNRGLVTLTSVLQAYASSRIGKVLTNPNPTLVMYRHRFIWVAIFVVRRRGRSSVNAVAHRLQAEQT